MKTPVHIFALGRRRSAVARIRLFHKKGDFIVNSKLIADYFPGEINRFRYLSPFQTAGVPDQYSATIKVVGSGKVGQLEAVIHGLARALDKADKEKFHSLLKKGGFLTRDSRTRQRRHVGTGGKSRRKKQSPKR